MNSLWPAASRLSTIQPQTFRSTCHKAHGLVARLAQRSVSSCSTLGSRKRWQGSFPAAPFKSKRAIPSLHAPGVRTYAACGCVITRYEDLPDDYQDESGVPFTKSPLSKKEVESIFGSKVDYQSAHRLLARLHGRRVAGTLEHPSIEPSVNPYEMEAVNAAITWLRKNVPVDEIRSAGIAAEIELAAMEADILTDSERLGLYKPNSTPKGKETGSVYGKGVLETVREHNQKVQAEKDAQEAKELSQADEIRQNNGHLDLTQQPRSKVELRRPGENPKLKYYLERAKILPDTPPEMTILQRLWPSGVLVVCVVLGCLVFAQVYRPPKRSDRLMPEIPPAGATFIGLFLLNLAVFVMWRHPPAFRILNKYFLTTPGYPFALSCIGNIFSHQAFSHLAANMTLLYFVGTRLHDEVGRGNFLAIYIACGTLGSFASLASWVIRANFISSSLGASGALAGIIATYLCLNSGEGLKFFGVFPPDSWPGIPSLALLAFLIGSDIFGLWRWNKSPTAMDHWAHLGGYASGICSAQLLRVKAKRRRILEEQRRKNEGLMEKVQSGRL